MSVRAFAAACRHHHRRSGNRAAATAIKSALCSCPSPLSLSLARPAAAAATATATARRRPFVSSSSPSSSPPEEIDDDDDPFSPFAALGLAEGLVRKKKSGYIVPMTQEVALDTRARSVVFYLNFKKGHAKDLKKQFGRYQRIYKHPSEDEGEHNRMIVVFETKHAADRAIAAEPCDYIKKTEPLGAMPDFLVANAKYLYDTNVAGSMENSGQYGENIIRLLNVPADISERELFKAVNFLYSGVKDVLLLKRQGVDYPNVFLEFEDHESAEEALHTRKFMLRRARIFTTVQLAGPDKDDPIEPMSVMRARYLQSIKTSQDDLKPTLGFLFPWKTNSFPHQRKFS